MSFIPLVMPDDRQAMRHGLKEPECVYCGPEPCRLALVFSAWDQSNIPWNFVQTDRTVPILSAAFGGIGSRIHQLSAPQTSNHFIFGGGNYDNSIKK